MGGWIGTPVRTAACENAPEPEVAASRGGEAIPRNDRRIRFWQSRYLTTLFRPEILRPQLALGLPCCRTEVYTTLCNCHGIYAIVMSFTQIACLRVLAPRLSGEMRPWPSLAWAVKVTSSGKACRCRPRCQFTRRQRYPPGVGRVACDWRVRRRGGGPTFGCACRLPNRSKAGSDLRRTGVCRLNPVTSGGWQTSGTRQARRMKMPATSRNCPNYLLFSRHHTTSCGNTTSVRHNDVVTNQGAERDGGGVGARPGFTVRR